MASISSVSCTATFLSLHQPSRRTRYTQFGLALDCVNLVSRRLTMAEVRSFRFKRRFLNTFPFGGRNLGDRPRCDPEADSNVGLQCHTAPFSWKLVFECDHQLFEVTMSACSSKEELEWRSRLVDHSSRQSLDAGEQALYTSLSLAIKPMGTVFGKPGKTSKLSTLLSESLRRNRLNTGN